MVDQCRTAPMTDPRSPVYARRPTTPIGCSRPRAPGHIVHDLPVRADGRSVSLESRPWRLDPIPLVIDAAEFHLLGDRVVARMRMLEAILDDVYGSRTLLTDRVLEPADVWASNRYRLAAIGQLAAPRWLTTYAVDVDEGHVGQLARRAGPHRRTARSRVHVPRPQRARPRASRRRVGAAPRCRSPFDRSVRRPAPRRPRRPRRDRQPPHRRP